MGAVPGDTDSGQRTNGQYEISKGSQFHCVFFFKTGAVDTCVFKSVKNMNKSFLISVDMVTADLSLEMF